MSVELLKSMGHVPYFKDTYQRDLFSKFAKEKAALDVFNLSFCYALSAIGKDLTEYLSSEDIDVDGLLQVSKPWATSEKDLLDLALQLNFGNDYSQASLHSIFSSLDPNNTKAAIFALKIRYTTDRMGY